MTKSLKAVLSFVLLGALSACSKQGEFVDYKKNGAAHDSLVAVSTTKATLSLNFYDATCITAKPWYDVILKFDSSSHRKEIRLKYITDGKFQTGEHGQIKLAVSRQDGLVVESDDSTIALNTEAVTIEIHQASSQSYNVEVEFFDAEKLRIAQFEQSFIEPHPFHPALADQSPDGLHGLYYWFKTQSVK